MTFSFPGQQGAAWQLLHDLGKILLGKRHVLAAALRLRVAREQADRARALAPQRGEERKVVRWRQAELARHGLA